MQGLGPFLSRDAHGLGSSFLKGIRISEAIDLFVLI